MSYINGCKSRTHKGKILLLQIFFFLQNLLVMSKSQRHDVELNEQVKPITQPFGGNPDLPNGSGRSEH